MANYFDQFDQPSALVGRPENGMKYSPAQMAQLNAARDALRAAEVRGGADTYGGEGKQQGNFFDQFDTAAAPKAPAAPTATPVMAGGSIVKKEKAQLPFTGRDVGMGARQVIDAGAQLLTRGLEQIPVISDFMRGQRQNVEAINQQALDAYNSKPLPPYADVGRGGGQALVTGPLAAVKAANGVVGLAAQGAGMGALSNALTPIYEAGENDFWRQKLGQAVEGAEAGSATGGAFGIGSKVIAPPVTAAAKALMAEKVTPTLGQMLGGAFKTTEEKLSSVPVLGDAIKSAQTKALDQYNVALYNRVLRNIGEKYDGPAGQEGIAAVGNKLSAAYDDALARSVPNVVSDTFRARMNELAGMAPEAKRADFVNVVNRELKVTPGNTITPSVAKDAEAEFGRLIRQYKGSAVADDREYASALQQAQANLRQLVAENNPAIAPRIQDINKGWSDLIQLENAANSTKAARNRGTITPADQLRGIKKSDYSVRDRRFARGEMPNQDFAMAADEVLSNKYPDSGSIGRLLMGGGLLTGAAHLEPTMATIAGLATLPYLPGGRQTIAAMFGKRPAGAEELGATLRALVPYLGAAAPAGLLSR